MRLVWMVVPNMASVSRSLRCRSQRSRHLASQAIMCWDGFLEQHALADACIPLIRRQASTLQIGLNTLLTPYGNNYNVLIAGSMFGILPILAIYLIFNRYLVEGMTSGAVKG